jgi:hypothetical protein
MTMLCCAEAVRDAIENAATNADLIRADAPKDHEDLKTFILALL